MDRQFRHTSCFVMNIYHSSFVLHSCRPATLEDVADKIHTLLIPYAIAWCIFKIDPLIRCSVYLIFFKLRRSRSEFRTNCHCIPNSNENPVRSPETMIWSAHSMLLLAFVECNAFVAELVPTDICGKSRPRGKTVYSKKIIALAPR